MDALTGVGYILALVKAILAMGADLNPTTRTIAATGALSVSICTLHAGRNRTPFSCLR